MLAYCMEDGLTCNRHVYKRGEIFVLPTQMEGDYGGLSPTQLASKQRQTYGKQMFSVPTGEEVIAAHKAGTIPYEWLSGGERKLVIERQSEEGLRVHEKAEALKEKLYEQSPDLKDEEEETVAVEHVAAVTDTPPLSPKPIRKTSSKRKTKKE